LAMTLPQPSKLRLALEAKGYQVSFERLSNIGPPVGPLAQYQIRVSVKPEYDPSRFRTLTFGEKDTDALVEFINKPETAQLVIDGLANPAELFKSAVLGG
jgi:hypothetical protein